MFQRGIEPTTFQSIHPIKDNFFYGPAFYGLDQMLPSIYEKQNLKKRELIPKNRTKNTSFHVAILLSYFKGTAYQIQNIRTSEKLEVPRLGFELTTPALEGERFTSGPQNSMLDTTRKKVNIMPMHVSN